MVYPRNGTTPETAASIRQEGRASPKTANGKARVVLFAADPSDCSAGEFALNEFGSVTTVIRASNLGPALPGADCAVAVLPHLERDPDLAQLGRLCSQSRSVPVVLATRRDAENVRLTARLVLEKIVWITELQTELAPAVRAAQKRRYFQLLAGIVAGQGEFTPLLRQALVLACESRRPFLQVSELAKAVGSDRRTLWDHWHAVPVTGARPHLKDFLGWILMLKVLDLRAAGRSWPRIADRLGSTEPTLRRVVCA